MLRITFAIALLSLAAAAEAQLPRDLLQAYASEAAATASAYAGPSAATGDRFFHQVRRDWSCASCHTADPRQAGRHAVTGKSIAPLAPGANAERFRDRARADKWFRRNCNDTLGRECTAAEKADVLAYLIATGGAR